jgi:WD40 repeat protein
LRRPLTGHTRSTERFSSDVNQIAFSTDGRTLASAGSDKTIRLWDVGTHRQRGAPLTTTSIVLSVAFSPNDRRLVSMGGDGTTRIWDVRTHKQLGPSLTPALPRT